MLDLKRILLATDFSACARSARHLACELAARFEAELHVLHVMQDLAVQVPDFAVGLSFPGYLDGTAAVRRQRRAEVVALMQDDLAAEDPGPAQK